MEMSHLIESRCYDREELRRPRAYSSARFVRCQRGNAQCVNVRLHQLAQRAIHELVTLQSAQPGESGGDDAHAEMPSAVARAGVAGVPVAVVDEFDLIGRAARAAAADDAFARERVADGSVTADSLGGLVSGGILARQPERLRQREHQP